MTLIQTALLIVYIMLSRTARTVPSFITRTIQLERRLSPQFHHNISFQHLRMASSSTIKLNTGAHIPAIGFGTWQDKDAQEPAVLAALKAGYRHIDTARIYGTEAAVGRALKKSGVPRNEVFLTTKLWNNSHHPDDVAKAFEASLKDLGVEYVDLYLIVCPTPIRQYEWSSNLITLCSIGL
jgi:diketogulonate reductase-like aldo/keto reductase